jgi:peptide-methionine (S)-S-oxide reductase
MRPKYSWLVVLVLMLSLSAAVFLSRRAAMPKTPTVLEPAEPPAGMVKATFGAGCFWCIEAVFEQLKGVQAVVSGYSGGDVKNPTYEEVHTGATGHAEAVQITFDPELISYAELLEVFWRMHDPTTPNRQGNDIGPQYRSVIFWHNEEQRRLAEHSKQRLETASVFANPIVTEIVPFTAFYRAEAYHQHFFAEHSRQPYCQFVIRPEIEKMKELFKDKLK